MSDSFKCNKILLLLSFLHITVVHSLSCPTLCDPMDCSMLGFPVLQYLLEFAQIYFHWIGDAIQHLTLCHPLLLLPSIFPGIWVFSNELALRIKWSKYWSFNFSISPSSEYSGLVSLSIDWFDLLAVQRTFKSLRQHLSLKASVLQCSAFFTVQLSCPCITTGKTIGLTIRTFFSNGLCFVIFCVGLS